MSSRHNTGKWRRGNFTSRDPVWRDEAVWACQRDGAGGWEQEGLMDEPLPDLHKPPQRGAGREPPEPGESGPGDRRQLILLSGRHGNSGHGTRLQSKHTAFDRACSDYTALCSGAAAPRELGLLAAPRISPLSSLYRDAFVRFRFAVSSSSPGLMRRVSLAVLWSCSLGSGCLQSRGSLSEVLGGPAQHWNTHSVGRDRLLLHDPYLPWAAMVPLTEIIRL